MKVILQQDVKKLGKKGDIVEVSEGYGRNFLLPRKAAVPATSQNLNVANAQAGSKARKEAMAADEAKLMAKQLEKVEVKIPVRIGDGGKLFGSVTGKDVSDALKKQHIDIDKRKITIQGEVTGTGVYEAVIKVHPSVTSKIKVSVVAE
ncbi:MAG: 50S ribosomal protein L9 [Mitsuokella jalaludinii]|uniref:50S ribosomal protein L9 n=1 Tax=Mitsuokella TaxID=52225 RepID=UPI0022E88B61|nr:MULTISPECIES: 50S ribosomal protein L9 [Mitsuokella]MCI6607828.1 50S ribosomal protein L9 [Mitsuokella jalaludinii]MCI6612114.1 50S ribosomal protein L9 [Mitsuokella jalaludinii]MCI7063264.1 50S ribosomal protein L9 [Mitsuokella jalaludinii]MCI7185944.1 50S ribosomal protein L9 [Mitsuokella jalaludinii]MCI7716370.1 50S ribosomal protein L9 [Mitsuokella jalaludinii]